MVIVMGFSLWWCFFSSYINYKPPWLVRISAMFDHTSGYMGNIGEYTRMSYDIYGWQSQIWRLIIVTIWSICTKNYEVPKLSRTDFWMRGWAKGFFFNLRKGSDDAKPLDVGGTDPTWSDTAVGSKTAGDSHANIPIAFWWFSLGYQSFDP